MDWRIFGSTFLMIFLAELGDKTQLAVVSQTAASSTRWTVFLAASLALVISTALGVLAGCVLKRFIPDERYIKVAAGIVFCVFGALLLKDGFSKRQPEGSVFYCPSGEPGGGAEQSDG